VRRGIIKDTDFPPKGTHTVSDSDSDSESWRQSAQRISFV